MTTTWSSDDGRVVLYLGDMLEVLPTIGKFETCITDPPYGIGFMGKEWDTPGSFVARVNDAERKWDHVGGNHNPINAADRVRTRRSEGLRFYEKALEWFETILVALKPGATSMAFGGTRMWHRLACAIEDAGLEVRDTLMWLYGQGFPKSYDISKAIDKAAGAEREVVGEHPRPASTNRVNTMGRQEHSGSGWNENAVITAPATTEAELWDSWGTALKPAWEPILLAMSPVDKNYAHNAKEHGIAGLHIGAVRLGHDDVVINAFNDGAKPFGGGSGHKYTSRVSHGRWPANVVVDEASAELIDAETGELRSGSILPHHRRNVPRMGHGKVYGDHDGDASVSVGKTFDYGGTTASRFFYCAKASTLERTCGGAVKNTHATVKPIALMRWLCRLTETPTKGTVLDPFMGSGSTGVAAVLEGRPFVGIEENEESFWIAVERIKRAGALPRDDAPINPEGPDDEAGQMELW